MRSWTPEQWTGLDADGARCDVDEATLQDSCCQYEKDVRSWLLKLRMQSTECELPRCEVARLVLARLVRFGGGGFRGGCAARIIEVYAGNGPGRWRMFGWCGSLWRICGWRRG